MSNLLKKLLKIQCELKAPKSQFNKFGGYHYRNSEDILEAVKPLCEKHGVLLNITDSVCQVGERYYIEAVVTVRDCEKNGGENNIKATAYAREAESQKGMAEPQCTGSASSYARKYALNGLFLIDDTKDADFHNNTNGKAEPEKPKAKPAKKYKDFEFLQHAKKAKEVIGEQAYYEVLGLEGVEHANEVPPDKREEILGKWRAKVK